MKASWLAFTFSDLPPQAFRADACRARPYENVSAHGLHSTGATEPIDYAEHAAIFGAVRKSHPPHTSSMKPSLDMGKNAAGLHDPAHYSLLSWKATGH